MLLYFFTFALRVADPTGFLVFTTVIYMAVTIVASVALGKLSDVVGRRRVFVFASGSAQAVAALLLAIAPSEAAAVAGAVLLGLGQGCFFPSTRRWPPRCCPRPRRAARTWGS